MRFLTLLCTLALTACAATPTVPVLPSAPAPLAHTVVDDVALNAAWKTFDVALDAINFAVDACAKSTSARCDVFHVGTPKARKLADAIDTVTLALKTAEEIDAGLSTADYKQTMARATNALADIKLLIKGN